MDGTHPLPRKNCQQDSSLTGQQFKIETGIVQGIEILQQNACIPDHNITGCRRSGILCPFHHFLDEGMVGQYRYTWNMDEVTQGTPSSSNHTKPPTIIMLVGEKLNHIIYRRSNGMDFPWTTKLSPSTQCAVVFLFGSLSPGITNEGCSRC